MVTTNVKRKKSQYSRKGCLQCKKIHTKCDEVRPACNKCVKRGKQCIYKTDFVFQKLDNSNNTLINSNVPFPIIKQETDIPIKQIPNLNQQVSNGSIMGQISFFSEQPHIKVRSKKQKLSKDDTKEGFTSGKTNTDVDIKPYTNQPIDIKKQNSTGLPLSVRSPQPYQPIATQPYTQPIINSSTHQQPMLYQTGQNGSIQASKLLQTFPPPNMIPSNSKEPPPPLAISIVPGFKSQLSPHLPSTINGNSIGNDIYPSNGTNIPANFSSIDSPISNLNSINGSLIAVDNKHHSIPLNHKSPNVLPEGSVSNLPSPANTIHSTHSIYNSATNTPSGRSPHEITNIATSSLHNMTTNNLSMSSTNNSSSNNLIKQSYYQVNSNTAASPNYNATAFSPEHANDNYSEHSHHSTHSHHSANSHHSTTSHSNASQHSHHSMNASTNINSNNNNNNKSNRNPLHDNMPMISNNIGNADNINSANSLMKLNGVLTNPISPSVNPFMNDPREGPSTLNINDLVYILPSDIDFFNLLTLDNGDGNNNNNPNPDSVNIHLFDILWGNANIVELLNILEDNDPIKKMTNSNEDINDDLMLTNDPRIVDFMLTLINLTHCACNFTLYTDEKFENILKDLLILNKDHSIIENVLMYDGSLMLRDMYHKTHLEPIGKLWDRYVRMPSLKRCLDKLRERINSSGSFSEHVAMSFVVVVLFSANSAIRSTDWRTHLKGSCQLLTKTASLLPKGKLTEKEQISLNLFQVVIDFFCHAEILAQITSDNGGSLISPCNADELFEVSPFSENTIMEGTFDLVRGYSLSLVPVLNKIYNYLKVLKTSKNINLSGSNLIKFYLKNDHPEIFQEMKEFGISTCNHASSLFASNMKEVSALKQVSDLRLKFTMVNCTKLYHLTIEIYLKVFFIRVPLNTTQGVEEIEQHLEKMLETIYAMPYNTSAAIACHWGIYMGAVIASIIHSDSLYEHFVDSLTKLVDNGLYVAGNSREKLNYIAAMINSKNYDMIVNGAQDFIVF
ncbi:unnamed protein product [[Candida] boidinii]|nr:unnamed protein product [[Candida] boidinii]